MKSVLLILVILLVPAHLASGQTQIPAVPVFPTDGIQFMKVCPPVAEMTYTSFGTSPDSAAAEAALCLGYIGGLAGGFNTHPELNWDVSGKTFGQVYDAVSDYIKKHPDAQKQPILSLVELTFTRPVKQKQ